MGGAEDVLASSLPENPATETTTTSRATGKINHGVMVSYKANFLPYCYF